MSSLLNPRHLTIASLLVTGLAFLACGSKSSTSLTPAPAPNPTPSGMTTVQVGLGDAPADWIMAFGMTVNSITLTNSAGGTVNAVPNAAPAEMMQAMASVQPIAATSVPQGTYSQAVVTFSAVSMGYMDPVAHTYQQKALPGPFTATVPFSPAMIVGATPMALSFDMNMGSSVTIDGSGNVILTPVMTASTGNATGTGIDPWKGTMQHRVGTVASLSGSQFSLGSMMGMQQATFATNASTQFAGTGLSGMGSMATGMLVSVNAALQADGSYLAQRVEAMGAGANGMMGGGLVTGITGNPPTQITLAANMGQGGGMMASSIAGTLAVTIPASAAYSFDADGVDLTALPFTPAFGPTSISKGQRVDVVSGSGMMGGGMMGGTGSLTASQVRLEQQGLHGTVSGYTANGSQAMFTLNLSADSAFTSITGAATVQVYQQAGTQFRGLTAVANGNGVVARGLLFHDPASGTFSLVSTWIEPGAATLVAPAAGTSTVLTSLGDAPSDWIMAFGMTVNAITLTGSNGSTASLMPTSSPMEMMQSMATVQPLSTSAVPQGTYTQAKVTFSAVTMGYLDPVSRNYTQKSMPGPFTATVPLNPAMTVGSSPMALSFDMNMASSVAMDGSGNVILTPTMTASMGSLDSSGANPWLGAMGHQVGTVVSASATHFTMGSMMGMQQTTFTADAGTRFAGSGLTGMGDMTGGRMVSVDAVLQADGSYRALRIESMGAGINGMMGAGVVSTITGNPPSQITLATSGGQGGGMMAASIASTLTVTLGPTTAYAIDSDGVDLTGLAFTPAFGPTTLTKGQRVAAVSTGGMLGGGMMDGSSTLSASQIRLVEQGLHGTVSNYTVQGSQATFTLTLPTDAAFRSLSGATSVQICQQAGTQLHGMTAIANANDVVVRGLVFNDQGTLRMVASWIVAP
jgi:hypothetical protein